MTVDKHDFRMWCEEFGFYDIKDLKNMKNIDSDIFACFNKDLYIACVERLNEKGRKIALYDK